MSFVEFIEAISRISDRITTENETEVQNLKNLN